MALTLNLLFHLHHETEAERPTPRGYAEVSRLIAQADDLPIGCAWLAEHHLDPIRGRLSAPLLMSVAAARETRRIRVGPCVLVLPLRHPLAAAEDIATADVLMDGRLAAGVGSGGNPEEFAAFGVPLDERRARYAESLDIVTRALRGERFGHAGDYYQFPEVALVPRPLQPLEELLWVAASSVTAAVLAGRSGGNLLLSRGMPLDALHEQIATYHTARVEAGYDPDTARIQLTRGVYVAGTDDDAWCEGADGIRRYARRTGREGIAGDDLGELARAGDFIVGAPTTCAEGIHALAATLPITDLACDIALIGMPYEQVARSLDLLGRKVAPLLNS
jgi:alkanesulfonate monooxygenase SsuD/methylene tetrahydromethanopterin reductase-like flavin-dependent oxidoreductase (luciferase family)